MSWRTDPHAPSTIIPSDYDYVLWYATGSQGEGVDCEMPKFDYRGQPLPRGQHAYDKTFPCCLARMHALGLKFAEQGGTSNCSCCGAYFVYGCVWFHIPTKEHIHLGHICANKYGLFMDPKQEAAYLAWRKQQQKLRSQAAKEKRFKKAALEYLEQHPDVLGAIDLAEATNVDPANRKKTWQKGVILDIAGKLNRYGSISEKQEAFLLKLAGEFAQPDPVQVEEVHVPAPTGRVDIRGEIVSVRLQDSDFGAQWKMVVKVQTPEGSWLCWSTVPAAILERVNGAQPDLKGKTVEFTATLTPGKDPHFAFAKRPTCAKIIKEEQGGMQQV